MNRADKRREERNRKKYEKRQTFSKEEVRVMNLAAYLLGVQWALQATRDVTGYGETRMKRIASRVKEIEGQELDDVPAWDILINEKAVELNVGK